MSDLTPIPKRALTNNFTKRTVRRSLLAKKRLERRRRLKGLFVMQKIGFLKHPVGVFITIAILITSGAGVYAAINWFNGEVTVTSDNSILTVDLSKCNSPMPPGIEPTSDRNNVQFKITGSPHIESKELEQKLLTNCEFDTVLRFYQIKFNTFVGTSPALVKGTDTKNNTVTLSLKFGGTDLEKTVTMKPNTTIYDKGEIANLSQLHSGDYVVIAYLRGADTPMIETENPFKELDSIDSIFKTQYDTREFPEGTKSLYSSNNIMPLDQYKQIHKK